MRTSSVLAAAAAALSLGCAAATAPQTNALQAPPEQPSYSRTLTAHVHLGRVSEFHLFQTLPFALSRLGFFVIRSERLAPDRYQLLTDWHVVPALQSSFDKSLQTRTRLVLEVQRRGSDYGLSLYSLSYVQDEAGGWRAAENRPALEQHVRSIGQELAFALK